MDHTMAKTKKGAVSKPRKHDDVDTVLAKIAKLKPLPKKYERRQTANNNGEKKRVRAYDMNTPDPYPVGKEAIERASKPRTVGERVKHGMKRRKSENHARVLENEAKRNAVREPKPLPSLPLIMEPKLPARKAGDKPNIIALVYAFRAFQQFSSAHARRNLNGDEDYYQGLKARLRASLEELGMADMFDWSDFR